MRNALDAKALVDRIRTSDSARRPIWAEHRQTILEGCRVFGALTRDEAAVLTGLVCVDGLTAELYEEGLITRNGTTRDRTYSLA